MNKEVKFKAYIHSVNVVLVHVDVYANGNIGVSYNNIPESFFKLYHVDWDDMCIRENGTYKHVQNILTGQAEYIWFEDGYNLMEYCNIRDINNVEIYADYIVKYNNQNWLVVWSYSRWSLYNEFNNCQPIEIPNYTAMTVLGNVYQNKELLKVTNGS